MKNRKFLMLAMAVIFATGSIISCKSKEATAEGTATEVDTVGTPRPDPYKDTVPVDSLT